MEKREEIVVLGAYRPFLSILTAFDSKNFRSNDRRVLKWSIFRAFSMSCLILPYVFLFLPMELITCFKHKFNLNVIGQEISFFLGGFQVLVIYGLLMWNRAKLPETCDYLHGIVKKRKNLWFCLDIQEKNRLEIDFNGL